MDELIKQVGQSGGVLVMLIPSIIQIFKKVPLIVKLQESFPVYQVASLALGIGGAFALGIANPIVAGVVIGLAAGKGYDVVKGEPK